ncbi:MAG: sensor histidine kinase, partial [Nitrospiria bacterium]
MASIGVLAAGIAHEINNPVGYISSNLEVLREEVHDLASYLKELENSHVSLVGENDQSNREREGERIRQVRSVVKIDQFFQDSEAIIRESKEGLDRIKRIILDLKKFSHPDENKMENVNLNHEIESTLNILASALKYKVKVVKEFDELPLIKCFQHQLNQVLMNILINAAQAIEERGVITIRTFLKDDCINVLIRDTGAGIPPEHLKKIFDPFFTTKPVGKGTGLGLYISYGVIEKHQGEISVESEVGKGSAFTIRLPLHPSEALLEAGMSSPF